jgi:hypothetical protein
MLQVRVSPEEDARLPIYTARILADWREFAPEKYERLERENTVRKRAEELALQCIITLERYQEHGLNSDQGREAAQQLITDSLDLVPND